MWAPQVAVKTLDGNYVQRTDVAIGNSLCPTTAVKNTTIFDLLCPTANFVFYHSVSHVL
jgi:hypothetical protein